MTTIVLGTGSFDEQPKINKEQNLNNDINQNINSVFSSYDISKDGTVDAYEQKTLVLSKIITKCHEIKEEVSKSTIELLNNISQYFHNLTTDGTQKSVDEIDSKLETLTEKRVDMILRMKDGNNRTNEFKNARDFRASKDLKKGDYYIAQDGECHIYDGELQAQCEDANFINRWDLGIFEDNEIRDAFIKYAIDNGRDRSNEFSSYDSFKNAKDLKYWDYCISYENGRKYFTIYTSDSLKKISVLNPNNV